MELCLREIDEAGTGDMDGAEMSAPPSGRTVASFRPDEEALERTVDSGGSEEELLRDHRRYLLTETTGYSDGTTLESSRLSFEIGGDGSIHTLDGYDRKQETVIRKTDLTGEREIPGAELQLLDEDGHVVETWISGESPHLTETYLEPGRKYRLREILPPAGYTCAPDIWFETAGDGTGELLVMEDDITRVSFLKTDITGERELAGARLQILDLGGNVVEEWVSGREPHRIEGKLTAGETYILHEVSPPAGYARAEDIEFTVSEDGRIDRVVMKDEASPRPGRPEKPVPEPKEPVPEIKEHGFVLAEYQAYLSGNAGIPLGRPRYLKMPGTGDENEWLPSAFWIGLAAAVLCLLATAAVRSSGRQKKEERKQAAEKADRERE